MEQGTDRFNFGSLLLHAYDRVNQYASLLVTVLAFSYICFTNIRSGRNGARQCGIEDMAVLPRRLQVDDLGPCAVAHHHRQAGGDVWGAEAVFLPRLSVARRRRRGQGGVCGTRAGRPWRLMRARRNV